MSSMARTVQQKPAFDEHGGVDARRYITKMQLLNIIYGGGNRL